MSESYLVVELNRQPVELCKLLKIANLVSGGGEAKVVISEGYVLLNGDVEYQKRKKVYHEDVVEFNGEVIQLIINEELSEEPSEFNEDVVNSSFDEANLTSEPSAVWANENLVKEKSPQQKSKSNKKPKKKTNNKTKSNDQQSQVDLDTFGSETGNTIQPKKRRPISF